MSARAWFIIRSRLDARQEETMAFTVTSAAPEGSLNETYVRPSDAYDKARECEASGITVRIRLPTGDEVTAEEFRELYLLKDED